MVLSLISLAMLYLLRPFAAGIVFIILVLQIFLLTIKPLKKLAISRRYSLKILILIIIAIIITPFAVPSVQYKIGGYYNYFIYTTFEKGQEQLIENRVQNDPRYASGNRVKDFLVASVRYAVTPRPTSLFGLLMAGGSRYWGAVDVLINIVNQIGYYVLSVYLIINARNAWYAFRQMSVMGRAVIVCLLTYWPIYSFHLYGITHQRLKLPMQISIFLIAMCVSKFKQNRRTNLSLLHKS